MKTNQDVKHSPTPWKVGNTILVKNDPLFSRTDVISGGIRVAAVAGIGDEQSIANAAFIVRAVNSHEALVEALCAVINVQGEPMDSQFLAIAFDKAKAALKLAGEV